MKVVTGFFLTLLIIVGWVIFSTQDFVVDVIVAAGYTLGEIVPAISILFVVVIWGLVAASGGK